MCACAFTTSNLFYRKLVRGLCFLQEAVSLSSFLLVSHDFIGNKIMEDIDTNLGTDAPRIQPFTGDYFDDDYVPRVPLEQDVNLSSFQSGAEFSIDGSEMPMEYETDYNLKETFKHLNPEMFKDDDDGSESDIESYEVLEEKMEDISPFKDKGVMKRVKTQGAGDVIPDDAFVTVHYNAYQEGQDEPFDSTYLRGRAVQFPLGKGTVVPGLDIGVRTMKKGEFSQFLFKPDYFLGPTGCPPRIPPNTPVMFYVELKKWEASGGAEEYYSMSNAERREANFSQVKPVALREKNEGNDHYNSGRFKQALFHYDRAIRVAEECRLKDEDEEEKQKKVLFTLYKNAGLAALKVPRYKHCLGTMRKALDYDPNNAQLLYIKGKALHEMGHMDQAKPVLLKAKRLKPGSHDIARELQKLESDMKICRERESEMYSKMFQSDIEWSSASKEKNTRKKKDVEGVDPEFYDTTVKNLTEFKNNKDAPYLPLPKDLSPALIGVVAGICRDLDLEMTEVSGGENFHYRITKPKTE